jgi:hypothetical protein
LAKRFATKKFATHSGTLLGRLPAREMMPVPRFSLKSANGIGEGAVELDAPAVAGGNGEGGFDALGFLGADLLAGADAGDGIES